MPRRWLARPFGSPGSRRSSPPEHRTAGPGRKVGGCLDRAGMVSGVTVSALRRLGAVLAPTGPPAGITDAEIDDDLLAVADRHDLLPAVRSALSSTGATRTVDQLRAAHRRNLARTLVLAQEVKDLLASLDEAGIPAAPLKGIDAVLEGVYPDPGARTMSDLD